MARYAISFSAKLGMELGNFDVFPNTVVDRGDMCSQTTHVE